MNQDEIDIRQQITDGAFLAKWIDMPFVKIEAEIHRRNDLIQKHMITINSGRSTKEKKDHASRMISYNEHTLELLGKVGKVAKSKYDARFE